MYVLNEWGLHVVEYTQKNFHGWAGFLKLISNTVGNPESMYMIYFPMIYPFDCQLGIKLLQAIIVGDWLNLIMKWALMGDRPYWWVHEMKLAHSINIQQFSNTCETGPGNPSGHVAITGIAWFILTQAIIDKVDKKFKMNIKYPAWAVYVFAMTLMGMSRIYIAAHFPHQCVFGFICAVISGRIISKLDSSSFTLRHYVLALIFSIVSIIFMNFTLEVCGVDVKWTIRLAHKWCANANWIHASTTPFYIMWRFMGITLGTGLLTSSYTYKKLCNSAQSLSKRILLSVGGVLTTAFLIKFTPKKISHSAMYMAVFVFHAILINITGLALPLGMQLIST
uniref:glucose-6-phosphatase n=1 Tax=Strigamia maritima TaxID=126957 RepID=T1JG42_STRMM